MHEQAIAIFCICDELVKFYGLISSIVSRMPRHIRASTEKGFYLKVFFIILAYLLNKSLPAI